MSGLEAGRDDIAGWLDWIGELAGRGTWVAC